MASMERLESFPYRHRVFDVMSSPVATATADTVLGDAARMMAGDKISSLVVTDAGGRAAGIVTERDVVRALSHHGQAALVMPLAAMMSSPVVTVRADAFVYAAIGRMHRLRLRHMVAVDGMGRPAGIVTVGGLLHLRAATALALGDEVDTAASAEDMARVKALLPDLARALLRENVEAAGVAAVTSSVLRDMTVRAAELAEASLAAEGRPAPAPWCLLLLGSGGRREALMGADQDNALVHTCAVEDHPWYGELGRRLCDALDRAGIPHCKGGVMAAHPEWRRSLDGWRAEIDRWIRSADGPDLLNVDIFVDFRGVYGQLDLAERLRDHLLARAPSGHNFLHGLAAKAAGMNTGLGLWGRLKTADGRIDLKTTGLLPLVSAVRLLALKHAVAATGTPDRLQALAAGGFMTERDARGYRRCHDLLTRLVITQQIADCDAGRAPSSRVEARALAAEDRAALKAAFKAVGSLAWVLKHALSTA